MINGRDLIINLYRWGGGQQYITNYISTVISFEYSGAATIKIEMAYKDWPVNVFGQMTTATLIRYDYSIAVSSPLFYRMKYFRVTTIYADSGDGKVTIEGVSPLYDLNTIVVPDKKIRDSTVLTTAAGGKYTGTASSVINAYIQAIGDMMYKEINTRYSYGVYTNVLFDPIPPWINFPTQASNDLRYDHLTQSSYDTWMSSSHTIYRTIGGGRFVDDVNEYCEDYIDTTGKPAGCKPFLGIARTSSAYDLLPAGTWVVAVDRPFRIAPNMEYALDADNNIDRRLVFFPSSPPGIVIKDLPYLPHVGTKNSEGTYDYSWNKDTITDTYIVSSYRPFDGTDRNNKVTHYEEYDPQFAENLPKLTTGPTQWPPGIGTDAINTRADAIVSGRKWGLSASGFYRKRGQVEYHLPENYILNTNFLYDSSFKVRDILDSTGNKFIERAVYTFENAVNLDITVGYA